MPNILLVDDHLSNLLALEQILSGIDANLFKATSGSDAMRALMHNEMDCILLDVSMPEMGGFELLETLAQSPKFADIPTIMITGKVFSENERLRAYQAGAVDFLVKPLETDVVVRKVQVFVDQSVRISRGKRTEKLMAEMAQTVLSPLRKIVSETSNSVNGKMDIADILVNLERVYETWAEDTAR